MSLRSQGLLSAVAVTALLTVPVEPVEAQVLDAPGAWAVREEFEPGYGRDGVSWYEYALWHRPSGFQVSMTGVVANASRHILRLRLAQRDPGEDIAPPEWLVAMLFPEATHPDPDGLESLLRRVDSRLPEWLEVFGCDEPDPSDLSVGPPSRSLGDWATGPPRASALTWAEGSLVSLDAPLVEGPPIGQRTLWQIPFGVDATAIAVYEPRRDRHRWIWISPPHCLPGTIRWLAHRRGMSVGVTDPVDVDDSPTFVALDWTTLTLRAVQIRDLLGEDELPTYVALCDSAEAREFDLPCIRATVRGDVLIVTRRDHSPVRVSFAAIARTVRRAATSMERED